MTELFSIKITVSLPNLSQGPVREIFGQILLLDRRPVGAIQLYNFLDKVNNLYHKNYNKHSFDIFSCSIFGKNIFFLS